jgi:hypothetical protein
MPEMTVWPVSSSVANPEGRVLLGQGEERLAQLVLVGLGLRLDGNVDDGLRELQRLEHNGRRRGPQRVTGARAEADAGDDVAGEDLVAVLTVVSVHLQQTTEGAPSSNPWSY